MFGTHLLIFKVQSINHIIWSHVFDVSILYIATVLQHPLAVTAINSKNSFSSHIVLDVTNKDTVFREPLRKYTIAIKSKYNKTTLVFLKFTSLFEVILTYESFFKMRKSGYREHTVQKQSNTT